MHHFALLYQTKVMVLALYQMYFSAVYFKKKLMVFDFKSIIHIYIYIYSGSNCRLFIFDATFYRVMTINS